MLFSSIPFLYWFLPCVLLVYFLAPRRLKNTVLLLASLVFYGWGEPRYLLVMLASIVQGYVFGLLIGKLRGRPAAKACLAASVVLSFAALAYFKYADFFLANFNALTGLSVPLLRVALPVGISFYTFQIVSYLVDVYRGDVAAQRSFVDLAAYVAMFPQLIAGPIVRYSDVAAQLRTRMHSVSDAAYGARRFVLGLAKKILLANQLGALVSAFRATKDGSVLYTWLYAVAFLLQIYYDFSGYSDMAIAWGAFSASGSRRISTIRISREHHGILAAVAHFARQLVPRLSLYPARRQPEGEGAAAFQHSDRLACNRTLARGRLELCAVGTVVRGAAAGREIDTASGSAKTARTGTLLCAACRPARIYPVRCVQCLRRMGHDPRAVRRRGASADERRVHLSAAQLRGASGGRGHRRDASPQAGV